MTGATSNLQPAGCNRRDRVCFFNGCHHVPLRHSTPSHASRPSRITNQTIVYVRKLLISVHDINYNMDISARFSAIGERRSVDNLPTVPDKKLSILRKRTAILKTLADGVHVASSDHEVMITLLLPITTWHLFKEIQPESGPSRKFIRYLR
jgi:hypothetical protein